MSKVSFRERNNPSTPSSGIVNVFIDTSGNLCWQDDTGKIGKLATAGSFTLTIPATGTAALLNVAQTFSAAQTFSSVLTAPGMKPASDSTTAWKVQNAAGSNDILTVDTINGIVDADILSLAGLPITPGTIMMQPNGVTWTSRTSAADNVWRSVCYGNGLFVAVADTGTGNRVMTSSDGITWTSRTSAADNAWRSVCYGNGLFVAVAITGAADRVMTCGKQLQHFTEIG